LGTTEHGRVDLDQPRRFAEQPQCHLVREALLKVTLWGANHRWHQFLGLFGRGNKAKRA
jgi:hypothetical protein